MQMDQKFKRLLQNLGQAVNEAVAENEGIAKAIQKIQDAGYDVFLVLEATIGFNKSKPMETPPSAPVDPLKVTSADLKFLRSLKISVNDLDEFM